jgi:hypothetical protein
MNCVVHGILPVEESVVQAGSCTYSRVYIPVYDRYDSWLALVPSKHGKLKCV